MFETETISTFLVHCWSVKVLDLSVGKPFPTILTKTPPFGFPVEEGFAEVHRSNMTKVLEDGTCLLRDDGKIIKPEGYSPPDLKSILNNNQK